MLDYNIIIDEIESYQLDTNSVLSFQRNLVAKRYKQLLFDRVAYISSPQLMEVIYQIKNNLYSRPKCIVCGCNDTKFKTHINNYAKYCSIKCIHSDKEQKSKNSFKAVATLQSIIDPETGMNLSSKRAYKTANTLKSVVDKDGISLLEKRTQKAINTHLNNIDAYGMNSYQRSGKESSKLQLSREYKIKHGHTLPEEISDLSYYTSQVRNLTERIYKIHKTTINPKKLKRGKYTYHIDHKISIKMGFDNKIPIHIIASVHNLEMKHALDNLSKWKNSDIRLEELLKFF